VAAWATTTTTTTTTTTSTTTSAPAFTLADTWLLKAIGAESKVGSVHIDGTIRQGTTSITLALVVNGNGEGGGTLTLSGSLIRLKRVGPLLYFNAPKKFWVAHAPAAEARSYGGKWIEVSALDARFSSFDQFLNVEDLVTAVFQGPPTPLTVSGPIAYHHQPVEIVADTSTVKGKTSTGRMYVAARGTPFVLKIVDTTPTQSGTILFSHYGKAMSITIPPEPINLAS
jgi:hypothetical protein